MSRKKNKNKLTIREQLNTVATIAIAGGIALAAVRGSGKGASAETPHHHKPDHTTAPSRTVPSLGSVGIKAAEKNYKSPTEITTHSRLSRSSAEKLFGVDLQEEIIYGRDASNPTSTEVDGIQHVAFVIGKNSFGWDKKQDQCLTDLWTRESNWYANATSGVAFGIPQALLLTKGNHADEIARDFPGYDTNPVSQVEWGEEYIHDRYGNPCNANYAWWHNYDPNGNHWY